MAIFLRTDNNLIKDLPDEIKRLVLKFVPINKLIFPGESSVDPFIDEYIKNYIDQSLLTNAPIFTFLLNTKLYGNVVNAKIKELSTKCATDYIKEQERFEKEHKDDNLQVMTKQTSLCLNINYYHGQHEYAYNNCPKQRPILTGFRYYINNCYESFSTIRNDNYREGILSVKNISGDIIEMLYHFMGMNRPYVHNCPYIYAIHSIEITEETFTDDNVANGTGPDINIINKYY